MLRNSNCLNRQPPPFNLILHSSGSLSGSISIQYYCCFRSNCFISSFVGFYYQGVHYSNQHCVYMDFNQASYHPGKPSNCCKRTQDSKKRITFAKNKKWEEPENSNLKKRSKIHYTSPSPLLKSNSKPLSTKELKRLTESNTSINTSARRPKEIVALSKMATFMTSITKKDRIEMQCKLDITSKELLLLEKYHPDNSFLPIDLSGRVKSKKKRDWKRSIKRVSFAREVSGNEHCLLQVSQ